MEGRASWIEEIAWRFHALIRDENAMACVGAKIYAWAKQCSESVDGPPSVDEMALKAEAKRLEEERRRSDATTQRMVEKLKPLKKKLKKAGAASRKALMKAGRKIQKKAMGNDIAAAEPPDLLPGEVPYDLRGVRKALYPEEPSLPEKFMRLAAVHDAVCEGVGKIVQLQESKATGKKVPMRKRKVNFALLLFRQEVERVRRLPETLKKVYESWFADVERYVRQWRTDFDSRKQRRRDMGLQRFTDLEELLLETLGSSRMTGEALAAKALIKSNSHTRQTLSNLVRRGVLDKKKWRAGDSVHGYGIVAEYVAHFVPSG